MAVLWNGAQTIGLPTNSEILFFLDKLLDYLLRTLPRFAYNKIDFFYEAVTNRIESDFFLGGGGGALHIMEWLKLRVLVLVKSTVERDAVVTFGCSTFRW